MGKTYSEMLNTSQWKLRRNQIIEASNFRCDDCGRCVKGCELCDHHDEFVDGLEVHHRYYRRGRKPWDYPDIAFLCLCRDCHQERTEITRMLNIAFGMLNRIDQEDVLGLAKMLLAKSSARNEITTDRWNPYRMNGDGIREEIPVELASFMEMFAYTETNEAVIQ